nr:hypothetical protein [Deltaproteobacteria bacterium]
RLASASDDRTARVWDLQGRELLSLAGHVTGGVKVIAWFPDGERLFTSGWDRTLRVWNARTGKSTASTSEWMDSSAVHAGTIAFGGRLVVTGGANKVVKLWDPATQALVAFLDGHTDQVSAVAVSADGRWLVSTAHDGTARIWDLGAALRLSQLGHQRGVRRLAWSADGTGVVTSALDGTIRLWDAATGQERQRVSPTVECNDGASTIGANVIAAGCADGNVHRWDARDRSELPPLTGTGRRVRHAVSSLDGSWIAAGHTDGWMHVWDAAGTTRITKKIHDHNIYGLRALRDGTLLTASLDNTVRRSTSALEPIAEWRAPGIDGLLDAAFDPKGRFVVAGGDGFEVFRWDATQPGSEAAVLRHHQGTVWSVDVAPDGATAATASSDGTILLWDTAQWEAPAYKPRVLRGPRGGVLAVAFSPDGSRLVSGHQRGAAIVWDVARGVPLRRLGASEAGEDGTCTDLESVPWNDPLEKLTILQSCLEPAGFERLSARTHLVLENQVDLVEAW